MIQINRRQIESSAPKNIHATVNFKDHNRADEARRRELNMRKIKGKTIRVISNETDNSIRYNNQANLFIKNIPTNIREFYEEFAKFGDILSAKYSEDEESNPLGYDNYYDGESADNSLKYFKNNSVWGNTLDVQRFQKKKERQNNLDTKKNHSVKNLPNSLPVNEKNQIPSFLSTTLEPKHKPKLEHKTERKPKPEPKKQETKNVMNLWGLKAARALRGVFTHVFNNDYANLLKKIQPNQNVIIINNINNNNNITTNTSNTSNNANNINNITNNNGANTEEL
jgi:hypothetical protein